MLDKGVFPESSTTITRREAAKYKTVVANKIRMTVATLSHILIPGVVVAVTVVLAEFKKLRTLSALSDEQGG